MSLNVCDLFLDLERGVLDLEIGIDDIEYLGDDVLIKCVIFGDVNIYIRLVF